MQNIQNIMTINIIETMCKREIIYTRYDIRRGERARTRAYNEVFYTRI